MIQILVILIFFLGTGSPAAADGGFTIAMPLIPVNWDGSPGSVTGTVYNALDNSPVDGVQVCYNSVCDNTGTHGTPGTYLLNNIPWGSQVINTHKLGFVDQTAGVVVLSKQMMPLDIIISDDLTAGNVLFRIVLTWRKEKTWPPLSIPNDLDSQLWITGADAWHIDPSRNRGACDGRQPNACVEIDAILGSGPETTDVREWHNDGVYYFGVLNVNDGYPGVPSIIHSSAKVQVFRKNTLPVSFYIPTTGNGDFWYVFKTDASQNITPTNCITWYPGDGLNPPSCP